MADAFQGPSATRVLGAGLKLLRAANDASVVTPDLNYGSNWPYANPLNISDSDINTFAGATAGGGTSSPSYKPAIRVAAPLGGDDKGNTAIVGCEIIYKWTNNNSPFETGARLDLYWQHPDISPTEYDHRLMHQWADLSFLDDVKTTEQYHFEGVTNPLSFEDGTSKNTYVTRVHTSGISSSSSLTLLIYDFNFLIVDRVGHINQG
jgi:hypothetical protein